MRPAVTSIVSGRTYMIAGFAILKQQRRNPTVTFQIKSNHPNTVALSFHSATDRSRVWPDDGNVYVIDDRNVHTYRLSCERGEQICYGAWVNGGALSSYWVSKKAVLERR